MDNLIVHTQTAYIKGRYILDNVICAHETLHSIRKNKNKYFLFKIDFEKTFDKVNWQFLLEILKGKHFGTKWILMALKWWYLKAKIVQDCKEPKLKIYKTDLGLSVQI
jgi:Reverse transcriptase (RNA-dependent DNA polymerase)